MIHTPLYPNVHMIEVELNINKVTNKRHKTDEKKNKFYQ